VTPVTKLGAGSSAWSRRGILAALSVAAFVRPGRAEGATVEMQRLKFAPAEIEITVGGTVTFVNLDLVPHTATGESFDTGTLRKNESREITFPQAGEFTYFCKFHRHMTGRIVVR